MKPKSYKLGDGIILFLAIGSILLGAGTLIGIEATKNSTENDNGPWIAAYITALAELFLLAILVFLVVSAFRTVPSQVRKRRMILSLVGVISFLITIMLDP